VSKFTEILTVSPLPDGRTWIIRKKFGYDIGSEGSNEFIEVPVGFMTDFASVPRLFWVILPQWGIYGNAAVIHDFCHWQQQITKKKGKKFVTKNISRKQADKIFLEGMAVLQVPFYHKYTLYLAVRAFGWRHWRTNQKEKNKGVKKVLTRVTRKSKEIQMTTDHLIRKIRSV
jgi:hypothetical protein